MKQAVLSKGNIVTRDVADPTLDSNGVLVKVEYSCISVGTEMSAVKNAKKSLIKRALENPKQARMALDILLQRGVGVFRSTVKKVTGEAFGNALGYSAAGTIIAVGENVSEFKVGQAVAIAGNKYASHAGYSYTPKNLTVAIPDGVSLEEASTVAIGSIALQGVRVLSPEIGENVVVMGLGLIGQLAVQMLVASGCRVIGIDINDKRMQIVKEKNNIDVINGKEDIVSKVMMYTGGKGADAVLFTAATKSSEPMSKCFQMLRRKGRFILLGTSGMEINRADIYAKELEFKIATSYGPGRYDSRYEEEGMDYPIDYVRWTENRNMQCYLDMIKEGRISIKHLFGEPYPVERANTAYQALNAPNAPMLAILSYHESHSKNDYPTDKIVMNYSKKKKRNEGAISYAVIGAGSFVTSMHLPNLKQYPNKFYLKAVMSRTGISAASLAAQYNAEYATTNMQHILDDPDVQLVIISTRHNLHAQIAIQALRAGKHVFVEKPPALNEQELMELTKAIKDSGKRFFVGYNRRYSKYAEEIKRHVRNRSGSLFLEYNMNAGYIAPDHWVHGKEGGGRIVGEGCHIIDLFSYLIESKPISTSVNYLLPSRGYYKAEDNVSVTITYEDGSIAVLNYFANGSKNCPKEMLYAAFDGKKITLNNYESIVGENIRIKKIKTSSPSKGQKEEILALYENIMHGDGLIIPVEELETTSRITFEINEAVHTAYKRICTSKKLE
ncbi:Gfo/Idh/MocA family oxidoreductase [Ruminiclostridium herbifermentans]|uniref:Gfo/Idh/MocA family oxidoreductase n=1 Tax=Ruminiclostridium herbifermentans TaxID=2488810 RepID=A0A4V6ENE4_9FIRM|nr:Gfo/Idh/MocA family oxidoreductase [Ruminiclostridium herbifermentans]QNU66796.1 Gfo/Idh/MocA family oxidoreductase [Ruminiclostridium herbifermentans]